MTIAEFFTVSMKSIRIARDPDCQRSVFWGVPRDDAIGLRRDLFPLFECRFLGGENSGVNRREFEVWLIEAVEEKAAREIGK